MILQFIGKKKLSKSSETCTNVDELHEPNLHKLFMTKTNTKLGTKVIGKTFFCRERKMCIFLLASRKPESMDESTGPIKVQS